MQPTDNYGGACDQLNTDSYINICGYNGAFEMNNYLYGGGLKRPSGKKTPLNSYFIDFLLGVTSSNLFSTCLLLYIGNEAIISNLLEFDQAEFFQISAPSVSSMDDIGYVYVPTSCANGAACKLHIAFHGCQQGRYK